MKPLRLIGDYNHEPEQPLEGALAAEVNSLRVAPEMVALPKDIFVPAYISQLNLNVKKGNGGAAYFAKPPLQLWDSEQDPSPWGTALLALLPLFFDSILALDLDFENLPVNRGTGLSRFSEYNPKNAPWPTTSIDVVPGTTAKAHGEIRPIRGTQESVINRFGWDFTPNVFYTDTGAILPALEIDGAGAVDPPAMEYNFELGRKSVLSMDGGDYEYENPQASGESERTPFEAEVEAPPEGHRHWMLRFNPISDTLIAGVMEAASNGSYSPLITKGMGALLLWAYLPTEGILDPKHYEGLNIPFNSFPRQPGDLIRLLSPLFNPSTRDRLRQQAPFFNPNKEFYDEGMRYPIPDDPLAVEQLNAALAREGKPLVPRLRGAIIDWFFTDVAKDPERLLAMEEMPNGSLRIRMKSAVIATPFGKIHTDPGTEINLRYTITPVENIEAKRWEARIGLEAELEHATLSDMDVSIGFTQLKAAQVKVGKVKMSFPSIPGWTRESVELRSPWKISIEAVEGTDMAMTSSFGKIIVSKFTIPLTKIGGKDTKATSFIVPEIHSQIGLNIKLKDQKTNLELEGLPVLKNIFYREDTSVYPSKTSAGLELSGGIRSAKISNPAFGWLQFIPSEEKRGEFAISGAISSFGESLGVSAASRLGQFQLVLQLPSVGISSGGMVKIPAESSSLRDGQLALTGGSEINLQLSGHMDIQDASHQGTELMEWGTFQIAPHVSQMNIQGDFLFNFSPKGFSLNPKQEGQAPLHFSCSLDGSRVLQRPNLQNNPIGRLPESAVIQTDVKLSSAKVNVEEIRRFEVQRVEENGAIRNKVTVADGGPLSIHHIEGQGVIWVDFLLWGFVRGFFPSIGGDLSKNTNPPPSAAPLLAHLPEAERTRMLHLFGDGDFVHIGKASLEAQGPEPHIHLDDLLMNLHETGGRQQYGLIRLPEFHLHRDGRTPRIGIGNGDFLANIFLSAPERGGYFRFYRWTKPNPKKVK